MAEIFPDEGLDELLAIFPRKTVSPYSDLWAGLFTSQGASSVITRTQTLANITEPSGGAYQRMAIAASSWGAPSTSGNGRQIAAAQITFPTATAPWGTINGYFLATASVSGKCINQANFDNQEPVIISASDTLKLTARWQYDG